MKKYILGAVLALGILITPASSYAAGLTSVQIQSILTLLSAFGADSSTISNVTTALNGGTPASTPSRSFCHTWNTDLTVGSTGEDVSALNQALTASGIDTTGNTSSFSENNAGDVVAFQSHYGIRQTGYVGPMTRAKLNALYRCSFTTVPTEPTTPSVSAPTITYASGKAAGNFEMDAGGVAQLSGSYLVSETQAPKVFIGGIQATVTQALDPSPTNTTIYFNVPSSLSAGQSYPLYVVSSYGTSNTVMIKILSVLGTTPVTSAPTLTFSASPTTITAGQSANLVWFSSNAYYCSDGGKAATSGSIMTDPLYATKTFVMSCTGDGGIVTKSVTITVKSSATAAVGTIDSKSLSQTAGTFSITGSATNSTGVTVLIEPTAYSGTRDFATIDGQVGKDGYYRMYSAVNGGRWSVNFSYAVPNSLFVLVYDTNTKALLATGTLNIASSGAVACSLYAGSYTASPYTYVPGQVYVVPGSSVTLFWESQNATSGVWGSGDKAGTSGSVTFSNLVLGANTWSIIFSGSGGSKTCSTTVYVDQKG